MPYKEIRIKPGRFLSRNGVPVYHAYKDGHIDEPRTFEFTMDPDHEGEELATFDVRELKVDNVGLLDGHPPYQTTSDPKWAAADDETRVRWVEEWKQWRAGGELRAIKAVIRMAIDKGLLKAPEPEVDA